MLVFVYGTLTEPERARAVLDAFEYVGDAVLAGLHRVEGEYPTLVPGGRVEGRLLRTDEVDRLDAYEGVDSGLYLRVVVPLRSVGPSGGSTDDRFGDQPGDAVVYVGDPDRLDAPAEWPGESPFERRVRDYLEANEVAIGPLPPDDRQR